MNRITLWRESAARQDTIRTCSKRAKWPYETFGVNHGEPRATQEPTEDQPRRPDRRRARSNQRCACRAGSAAGAPVEPAVLRRSRHANRQRWYVVLHGDANRPFRFGAAVLDYP